MRNNLPVTNVEVLYPDDQMLVSMTDTKGIITHCNHAFVSVSGFTYEELIGQPHNLIRHPDMPAAAFKDMWRTVGGGRPWTGLVKNRCKNGDYYWVQANVTPIMANGKPSGYMSVRVKPDRDQVQAAERLYARMNAVGEGAKTDFALQAGQVRLTGLRGAAQRVRRASLVIRMTLALCVMIAFAMVSQLMHLPGWQATIAQLVALILGAAGVVAWFQRNVTRTILNASTFANDMASCNLTTALSQDFPEPMGTLAQSLRQVQINLRAVVGDVRGEIASFTQSASEIAAGGMDLSARTESQASSLQQTAASMEQLSGTVKQTAGTANEVAAQSTRSTDIAMRGGEAVHQVALAMQAIDTSSNRMSDIIGVIEGIAFQTNILALNAAVEAARAGEQGRGFAVVASEVRALAHRSSEAAREVRQLIADSSQQIHQGAHQMKSAGATIEEVVKSVKEVSELIKIISNATHEQAGGIAQVNQAVTQLDSVTQQNAALVEQSAASAAGLNSCATTLARSVQVFQLA